VSVINDYSQNVLKQATEDAEKRLSDFAGAMAAEAKTRSPVDTGNNRDSIDFEAKGLHAEVFTESGYGGFLEVGTSRMAARPYFRPAFDAVKGTI
jgi:HK97 gp10 family phage protein